MAPGLVGIRDTKDRSGGTILVATPAAWNTFLRGIRAGEFDAS